MLFWGTNRYDVFKGCVLASKEETIHRIPLTSVNMEAHPELTYVHVCDVVCCVSKSRQLPSYILSDSGRLVQFESKVGTPTSTIDLTNDDIIILGLPSEAFKENNLVENTAKLAEEMCLHKRYPEEYSIVVTRLLYSITAKSFFLSQNKISYEQNPFFQLINLGVGVLNGIGNRFNQYFREKIYDVFAERTLVENKHLTTKEYESENTTGIDIPLTLEDVLKIMKSNNIVKIHTSVDDGEDYLETDNTVCSEISVDTINKISVISFKPVNSDLRFRIYDKNLTITYDEEENSYCIEQPIRLIEIDEKIICTSKIEMTIYFE